MINILFANYLFIFINQIIIFLNFNKNNYQLIDLY